MRDGTPKGYAILNIDNNQYKFDYKVVDKDDNYSIGLFGPSVVKAKYSGRYHIYANFFIGSPNDQVRYKIDNGDWIIMDRVEGTDPAYMKELLAYDGAETLVVGRRPSDPVNSAHLWKFKLPKLKAGKHSIEVEAVDMFGRTHSAKKELDVLK